MTRMEKFVIFVSLVCCAIMAAAAMAQAATVEELQAQLAALQAQLAAMQAEQQAATPAPAPVVTAEPVVTAAPAKPVEIITPAAKPAPAATDGEVLSDDQSGRIYYDPDEEVRADRLTVWLNTVEGQRLVNIYGGLGKPAKGDRQYLFVHGRPVKSQPDWNMHFDGSPRNGGAFKSARKIVGGFFISSQRTVTALDRNGRKVTVWLNVCVSARDGASVSNVHGVWNLREFFDHKNDSFSAMEDSEWLEREMQYAGSRITEKNHLYRGDGDPSYFALYRASKDEVVDLDRICDKLIIEGKFRTFSPGLPEQPIFKGKALRYSK